MGAELDKDAIAKAYARWAPIYDFVFGAVFDRGLAAALEHGAEHEIVDRRPARIGLGDGVLVEFSPHRSRRRAVP